MNFWRRKPSLDAPKSKTAVDIAHKKKQLQTAGLSSAMLMSGKS